MTIIRFYFPSGQVEIHRFAGDWTRAEFRERAEILGAVVWEEV